jgi:hypothetical protein
MQTKFKIVEAENYILAVSNEEIKDGDLCVYNKNYNSRNPNWELIRCGVIEREEMHPHSNNKLLLWMKKIAAYQPKDNAAQLNLPLLPEVIAEPRGFDEFEYTEEDLRKTIDFGSETRVFTSDRETSTSRRKKDEFIQSLKQPKTPMWFEAETTGGGEYLAGVVGGNEIWAEYPTKLKTTTNSEGKQVLVGTYLYD